MFEIIASFFAAISTLGIVTTAVATTIATAVLMFMFYDACRGAWKMPINKGIVIFTLYALVGVGAYAALWALTNWQTLIAASVVSKLVADVVANAAKASADTARERLQREIALLFAA